jgi:uroporphyrinogen-III synthase
MPDDAPFARRQMTGATSRLPLTHRGIVITRPAAQAAGLARLIEERGGRAILFPVIEIVDVPDLGRVNALIDGLDTFDIAIFVSPNAAAKGMSAIRARRDLPARLTVIAIGGGSARELERHGVRAVVTPQLRADSEGVLELDALREVRGKRIAIFRGVGGRELLRETLAARGAIVEYAECYERLRPRVDPGGLIEHLRSGAAEAFVCTSSEGVANLHAMLGPEGEPLLQRTPVFVPHPRIASAAARLGLARVFVTERGDDGIVRTIEAHFGAVA